MVEPGRPAAHEEAQYRRAGAGAAEDDEDAPRRERPQPRHDGGPVPVRRARARARRRGRERQAARADDVGRPALLALDAIAEEAVSVRRGEEHGAAARLGRRAIAADQLLAQDEHARRADAAGQLVARKHQRVGRDAASEVESRRVVRGGGRPVEDGQGPPSFETLRDGADVRPNAGHVRRRREAPDDAPVRRGSGVARQHFGEGVEVHGAVPRRRSLDDRARLAPRQRVRVMLEGPDDGHPPRVDAQDPHEPVRRRGRAVAAEQDDVRRRLAVRPRAAELADARARLGDEGRRLRAARRRGGVRVAVRRQHLARQERLDGRQRARRRGPVRVHQRLDAQRRRDGRVAADLGRQELLRRRAGRRAMRRFVVVVHGEVGERERASLRLVGVRTHLR